MTAGTAMSAGTALVYRFTPLPEDEDPGHGGEAGGHLGGQPDPGPGPAPGVRPAAWQPVLPRRDRGRRADRDEQHGGRRPPGESRRRARSQPSPRDGEHGERDAGGGDRDAGQRGAAGG